MAKVHSVRFHGRTYCGLPCQTIPLASSVSYISCKRCHDGFMEWICSMLQVTAEILEEQAADKAQRPARIWRLTCCGSSCGFGAWSSWGRSRGQLAYALSQVTILAVRRLAA